MQQMYAPVARKERLSKPQVTQVPQVPQVVPVGTGSASYPFPMPTTQAVSWSVQIFGSKGGPRSFWR